MNTLRVSVLRSIQRHGPQTAQQAADCIGCDKSTAGKHAQNLVATGALAKSGRNPVVYELAHPQSRTTPIPRLGPVGEWLAVAAAQHPELAHYLANPNASDGWGASEDARARET